MKRKMNRTVVGILTAAAVLTLGTASTFMAERNMERIL